MNRAKRLGILLGVLVVVCAAAAFALHTDEKQEEIKTSGEDVLSIEPAKVTALSWTREGTTLSFHRDDGWQYDDDGAFPVSESAIENLLDQFYPFGAAFTIEHAEDLGQYGLDDPACTITLTTDEQTYTVKLGDYSTMDAQRYVDIGDGNVYLAAADPMDAYDVELKDLIANDPVPDFEEVSQLQFSGSANYTAVYDEDRKSLCADDTYFTADGQPLDTSRVKSYLTSLRYLALKDYVTYRADDADLADYGLDAPELTVSVDYTDDGTSGTFVLHISRDPAQRAEAAAADSDTEEDASDITAYARVGDSSIVYQISGDDYTALMAAGYDDLRHQALFSGDFDQVTGIDATLDGETYTLTSQKDGKDRKWLYQDEEVEPDDLKDALTALTADEFTDEKAAGQQELSLTLHLDNEDYPQVTITLYRQDGARCLAAVDGQSTAYVQRSSAVDLMEAIRAIVLNG